MSLSYQRKLLLDAIVSKVTSWGDVPAPKSDLYLANLYRFIHSLPVTDREEEAFALLPSPTNELTYLSQRDMKGDVDGDGRLDWFQTCLTVSATMVINYYRPHTNLDINTANKDIVALGRKNKLSRYYHSVIIQYLKEYGIKSNFAIDASVNDVIKHLQKGELVIWCNKLTHSGHCVVLKDYDFDTRRFLVYDPYGEPMIGSSVRYEDIRNPYWLTTKSFERFSMSSPNKHWVHFLSK